MSRLGSTRDQFRSKNPVSIGFTGTMPTTLMLGIILTMAFRSTCFGADNPPVTRYFGQKPLIQPVVNENLNWLTGENPLVTQLIPSSKSISADPLKMWAWLPRPAESKSQMYLKLVDNNGDNADKDKADKKDDDKPDKKDDDNKSDQKTPPEPDISKPGADFGDYPNSAYTLPKGLSYLDIDPFTYVVKERHNAASYSYNYLFR